MNFQKVRVQWRCWHKRLVGIMALALALAVPTTTWAHAILVESMPKLDSVVTGPEFSIVLRFNVRIDARRSRLRLSGPDGALITVGIANQPSPDTLQSTVRGLKPGAYQLIWQVLASDGHMSEGKVPFTVK